MSVAWVMPPYLCTCLRIRRGLTQSNTGQEWSNQQKHNLQALTTCHGRLVVPRARAMPSLFHTKSSQGSIHAH